MKGIISLALIAFFTISVSSENLFQTAAIMAAKGMCQGRTQISETELKKLQSWDFSSTDDTSKRYVYCVFRHLQLMNRESKFNKEHALNVLPEETDREKFSAAVDACINPTGADRYEKAFNFAKCYNSKYPKDITIF